MLPLDQRPEFLERLARVWRERRQWASRNRVSCYRIYDKDLNAFPFVIDLYENQLVWSILLESGDDEVPEEFILACAEYLEIDRSKIHLKVRRKQKGNDQYEKLDQQRNTAVAREGGLKFLINLSDYLDTGLFLDHRWSRSYIRDLSAGRKVLNLFCYTGSFSVYAAHGGAFETTSVDLNANYLDWAQENFKLNGLESPRHKFLKRDAVEFLRSEASLKFDVIVLDPPTFSNSKKMDGTFDVQRDHGFLIQRSLKLLNPDGVLFFSTNFQKFRLEIPAATPHFAQEITKYTVPADVRKGSHRSWLITKPGIPELVLKKLEIS